MSRCKWRWCKSWNTRRAMALVTLPQTSSLNPSMHRIDQFFELISPWCMQRGGFRLHYTQSFVGQQWRHHHNNCLHCAQSEQTLLWKVDRYPLEFPVRGRAGLRWIKRSAVGLLNTILWLKTNFSKCLFAMYEVKEYALTSHIKICHNKCYLVVLYMVALLYFDTMPKC